MSEVDTHVQSVARYPPQQGLSSREKSDTGTQGEHTPYLLSSLQSLPRLLNILVLVIILASA